MAEREESQDEAVANREGVKHEGEPAVGVSARQKELPTRELPNLSISSSVSPPSSVPVSEDMASLLLAQLALVVVALLHLASGASTNEANARKWTQQKNKADTDLIQTLRAQTWEYVKDPSAPRKANMVTAQVAYRVFEQGAADGTNRYAYDQFNNRTLARLFEKYAAAAEGTEVLDDEQLEEHENLKLTMMDQFNSARHHDYCTSDDMEDCIVPTTAPPSRTTRPGTTQMPENTTDEEDHDAKQEEALEHWNFLKHHWHHWREDAGKPLKETYTKYMGFEKLIFQDSDYREYPGDVHAVMDRLMEQIKPFYQQLHAYVRMHLEHHYVHTDDGPHFPTSGQIPAHILGHDSGNIWSGVHNMMRPYPDEPSINFDARVKEIARTPEDLMKQADQFYQGLGFSGQPRGFWESSILDGTPEDDGLGCVKVYLDMMNGRDYYVKQCMELNHRSWHHSHIALAYINYYRQYHNQFIQFRQPAHIVYAAALADSVSLSVMTPSYLKKKNILRESFPENDRVYLNLMLATALKEVPLIPYAYMVERWRDGVIVGNITQDDYNVEWWKLRCKVQGVWPPVERDSEDFDPGAHAGIALDIPYAKVFLATVLEFQVYKHLCGIAGHRGELHKCDFSDKRNVGNHLKRVMAKGSSEPWETLLREITDEGELDASALLEYFEPLHIWLRETNLKHKESVGWEDECSSNLKGGASVSAPLSLTLAVVIGITNIIMALR